jgi:fermentation-respiration switch protein FrsA (DUF1100 family)
MHRWIIQLLLILVVFMVGVYLFQRRLIYFPTHQIPQLSAYQANDMSVVKIKTRDHLELMSWYKPAHPNQPTLLFLHGNAGHIGYRMSLVRQFLNNGIGVLLLEYRGYGGNSGSPTEQGLYEDGQAALNFLYENNIKPHQIILFGESLGTGVATKLAFEQSFCALILQSPYTSLASLSRYHYPWLILKPWDRFNSLERMEKIHTPLLILHGKEDQIVPFSESKALLNRANEPKQLIVFENKNHNNLWDIHFAQVVIKFIENFCQN